jgi:Sulfotransferase family
LAFGGDAGNFKSKAPKMSQKPPLFIVGAPRSGNTLTRRVLIASGQIYIPPETYVFGELTYRWRRWMFLSWREKVFLFCAYFDRHEHFPDFEIDSLTPFSKEAYALDKSKQNLHGIFECFYAFMARSHGFTDARWGDKTPLNTYFLNNIVRAYPDAYYLYLKRDGRDVVASQLKSNMRDFDDSVQRWIDANAACRRYLRRVRRRPLEIAYEDLVAEPAQTFEQIFDWAELSFDAKYLNKVPANMGDVGRHEHHAAVTRPITASSIGKWKDSLSPAQFETCGPEFLKMMRELGYDV